MRALRVLLILLAVNFTASADIKLALEAYEHGDYINAFRELSRHAKAGDAQAQYHLAFLYYEGHGTSRNLDKAVTWFKHAAYAGYGPAQDTLAYLYYHGLGLEKDLLRAYVWYSLAASNGIFLAETIKEDLGNELNEAQRAQAEIMIREYALNSKVLK